MPAGNLAKAKIINFVCLCNSLSFLERLKTSTPIGEFTKSGSEPLHWDDETGFRRITHCDATVHTLVILLCTILKP